MAKTTIQELTEFGQSVWLDTISRSLIDTGRVKELVDLGVSGMTSNPTIFDKAVSSSSDYDDEIHRLHDLGKSAFEIYDDLTVRDIQDAADIFKPVYESTNRVDGYVSLEIDPRLAAKTAETVQEGRRLHKKVARPNVMFKVPATDQGFGAIEELLADGINVNVTLIFSVDQYVKTAKAFLNGMARLADKHADLSRTHSVASVFVSRIDTAVDAMLDERAAAESKESVRAKLSSLRANAAVANATLIYEKYAELFSGKAFQKLKDNDAHVQRVLWGSTSTKDPAYSDIKYVAELIAKDTVNTMPEKTLEAFLDHGRVEEAVTADAKKAEQTIDELSRFGVDIDAVCAKLLDDGVAAFTKSFNSLLNSIREKAGTASP
jgi:transaldolase